MKNILSGSLTLVALVIPLAACITIVTKEYAEAKECLALNVYHEARGESEEGQYAVAHVTMNRVDSPRYDNTVCEVVYARKQFSWTHLIADPRPKDRYAYHLAKLIAADVLGERVEDNTGGADHYHADYVSPNWATEEYMNKTTTIGTHIFYKAK
tara:strand:- start:789 stop:1253 length:465 start_codon:yes stop_codon:yes gene_type:complete